MRVIYDGPLDGVEITLPGDRPLTVARGETIEVPDEFGERLIEQEIWITAPAPRRGSAPTAATTPEEDD